MFRGIFPTNYPEAACIKQELSADTDVKTQSSRSRTIKFERWIWEWVGNEWFNTAETSYKWDLKRLTHQWPKQPGNSRFGAILQFRPCIEALLLFQLFINNVMGSEDLWSIFQKVSVASYRTSLDMQSIFFQNIALRDQTAIDSH